MLTPHRVGPSLVLLALAAALGAGCASGQAPADEQPADAGDGKPDAAPEPDAAAEPDAGPQCGDGVVQPGVETCDDGNATTEACDYGAPNCIVCDATCHQAPGAVSRCGDGAHDADHEACDDGNTVTEVCAYDVASCTVCDAGCAMVAGETSSCGDLEVDAPDEGCDDGNTLTELCAYGLASCTVCNGACQPQAGQTSRCGDQVVDIQNEGCDDGNTAVERCAYGAASCSVCGASCQFVAGTTHGCGDALLEASFGEECEDGNAAAGDGCTPTCQQETLEEEPNEDGAPSTGGLDITGNDFASANALSNGVFELAGGAHHVVGSLFPAGDEDVFAVRSTGAARTVVIETFGADGYGTCPSGHDTGVTVRDAAGAALASDDDGGPGLCSRLVFDVAAGATVFVHVAEFNDNNAIGRYFLVLTP